MALTLMGFTGSNHGQTLDPPSMALVNGDERIAWDQPTAARSSRALTFAAYVDGIRVPLIDAVCQPVLTSNGSPCSAPLPPLSAGRHLLEIVAVDRFGDIDMESARATMTVFRVAPPPFTAVSAPTAAAPGVAPIRVISSTRDGIRFSVETIATNLDRPTAIAITPEGRLVVVERGREIRIRGQQHDRGTVALTLADVLDRGDIGALIDIALHPDFARNRIVYVLFVAQAQEALPSYRLARFRESNGTLAERAVLLDSIPVSSRQGGPVMRFGPDRRLYLGLPDLDGRSVAQDLGSLNGKILRFNDDVTVPADNPFGSPVFSTGHAAPVGLAWHPTSGALWETERAVNGDDELNLVTARGDYGWTNPQLSSRQVAAARVTLGQALEPAGAAFYTGTAFPEFRGDLFFVSRAHRALYRVRFDPDTHTRVVAIEPLLENRLGRLGGVFTGLDGGVYVFTANRGEVSDGDPNDDRVVRIVPAS
jgi:glucose/arabinose dehydrogenase